MLYLQYLFQKFKQFKEKGEQEGRRMENAIDYIVKLFIEIKC